MPIVLPGASEVVTASVLEFDRPNLGGSFGPEGGERCRQGFVVTGQHCYGEESGVGGACVPIAMVATGTPPGICTIDSKESMPLSVRLLIGTPITGTIV